MSDHTNHPPIAGGEHTTIDFMRMMREKFGNANATFSDSRSLKLDNQLDQGLKADFGHRADDKIT